MDASRQFKFRVTAFVVAFATLMIFTGSPPGRTTHPPQYKSKWITLRIILDGSQPVQATQLVGRLIKIRNVGKAMYGFAPVISDPAGGAIKIRVYRINKVSGSGGAFGDELSEIQDLVLVKPLEGQLAACGDANANYKIEVLKVQTELEASREGLTGDINRGPINECIATCEGVEITARSVSTACGGCHFYPSGEDEEALSIDALRQRLLTAPDARRMGDALVETDWRHPFADSSLGRALAETQSL